MNSFDGKRMTQNEVKKSVIIGMREPSTGILRIKDETVLLLDEKLSFGPCVALN